MTSRRGSSLSISTFHISGGGLGDEDPAEEDTSARAFSRYSALNLERASFSAGVNAETSGEEDIVVNGRERWIGCGKESWAVCVRAKEVLFAATIIRCVLLWQRWEECEWGGPKETDGRRMLFTYDVEWFFS